MNRFIFFTNLEDKCRDNKMKNDKVLEDPKNLFTKHKKV